VEEPQPGDFAGRPEQRGGAGVRRIRDLGGLAMAMRVMIVIVGPRLDPSLAWLHDHHHFIISSILRSSCSRKWTVIVAVVAVRVVQVAVDEIIDVIAVRNRGVTASCGVDVPGSMAVACVVRRACRRVCRIDGDRALVGVIAVHHVQVTIV
jgi:hypothetical protein